jgi:hypothetical protein
MSSRRSYDSQTALDLLAQLQDPQWALDAARIEEEASCDLGAGHDWGPHLDQFMTDPHGYHQFQQLKSLVLNALRRLLADGNLGVGTDAAWLMGKERLLLRLQHPSSEIQAQLKAVLTEDLSTAAGEPLSETAQMVLQQAVCAALTPEDWDAIALAAANAVQQHVAQHLKWPQSA